MFIDTHSKESMEKTLCDLLNVTEDELYVIISEIGSRAGDDYDIWKSGIRDFINQHRPSSLPDEILLFHLARRLQGTEDDVIARNLLDLLSTENAFSKVLKEHKVEFYKEDGHFRLQPENDAYEPIIVDEVSILGKVNMVIRTY